LFDPLEAATRRTRITEKRDALGAERRAAWNPSAHLDAAAAETMARLDARPTSEPSSLRVDVSDVDVDLVGSVGVADAAIRRLDESINSNMESGYLDFLDSVSPEMRADLLARDDAPEAAKRRAADRSRVRTELSEPGYTLPPKAEPERELSPTEKLEAAARDSLAKLFAPQSQRGRRR
jgi:hypothetical protein